MKSSKQAIGRGATVAKFVSAFLIWPAMWCCCTFAHAEDDSTTPVWDMQQFANAPTWEYLELPKADGVRAIRCSGPEFQGEPTRVFAWLGVPETQPGEKVPAMVLIHGGGGTAFDDWVRLWVGRGYAAIAMDTCGQVPVGNYGQYLHDPSVYLGNATMPMLWVTGSNDFAYPLGALQSSYRLPTGPRTLCVRLRMPHGHGGAGENPEEIRVFADAILKKEMALPEITGTGRDGDQAWATFTSNSRVVSAVLNFTRDEGAWQDLKWEAVPAELNADRVVAELPAETMVYYFNLTDERDCVVSTEHETYGRLGNAK